MKRRGAVLAVNLGAAGVLAGAAFAFTPMIAAADSPQPKTAAECRAITDFNLRGACLDSLDKSNQQEVETSKETKKREFGLGLRIPSVSALIPRKEDIDRQAQRDREEIRTQTITLASVDTTPLGKLLLTSDQGAVWEQTDGDAVLTTPEPGDEIKVSKGTLGGYMCQVTRWVSVRCQRDR